MSPIVRKAVRVLLLNDENQLLLMCIENPDLRTSEGISCGKFWLTIGGGIEATESIEQAAYREIYEESGINAEDISMGSVVWYGCLERILRGKLTRFEETFIVARTKQKDVALYSPTETEKLIVKDMRWFSLVDIKESPDTIFPILLPQYLPDILAEKYPLQPIEIHSDAGGKNE